MNAPAAAPANRDVPCRRQWPALGTTALLLVTEPALMSEAAAELRAELAAIDEACSRFRADSEISRAHAAAGRPVRVGPVLAAALEAAVHAAELTDGLVDPTVGEAVAALGYDRDFTLVQAGADGLPAGREPVAAPGWWRLGWRPEIGELVLPLGIALDLGATAKALAADRAAARIAQVTGAGVLVDLGGDLSVAGDPPPGGWRIALGDDHRTALDAPAQAVSVAGGGLATSGTVARAWIRGGRRHHHIVDPRTGENPPPVWRTVTVAAGSCLDANTASTAAIVLGDGAPDWLAERGLPARLVGADGRVVRTAGWPDDRDRFPDPARQDHRDRYEEGA